MLRPVSFQVHRAGQNLCWPYLVTGFHNSFLCLLTIVPTGKILGQKGGYSQGDQRIAEGQKQTSSERGERERALPVNGVLPGRSRAV